MYCSGRAYAKLNLTLNVNGLRQDGYHEMEMIMQTVSLYDSVTVETNTGAPWCVTCDGDLPSGPENLAWKAAEAFYAASGQPDCGVRITIKKRIPAQAGMAGGSADAAAVLRLLNSCYGNPLTVAELCNVAEKTGSDVPFCVVGGTALVLGRGERICPLPPLPPCHFVLCRPDFSVSTPEMFRELDSSGITERPDTAAALSALKTGSLPGLGRQLRNVFESLALIRHPQAERARQVFRNTGALGCCMTGTGSVFYGLYDRKGAAGAALNALTEHFADVWYAEPVWPEALQKNTRFSIPVPAEAAG